MSNIYCDTLLFCEKHHVQLSASKTKLLAFDKHQTKYVKYSKLISPLHINQIPIPFASTAEHVGVLRSVDGNLPHIHQRMVNHRRSLAQILSMGMAKRHRANPLATLRAETIFSTPVLYSGMASLLMSKSEVDILSRHVKVTTENLLKLHPKTPEPVVFFLAGKLPGEALLHLKQLTLFGMICQLRGNILNNLAVKLLTNEKQTSKNWFAEIRSHCFTYNLPHPLLLLRDPPSKERYKKLLRTNITDFWQSKLREQCVTLESKSLKYFKPKFMSLSKPHPMYTYALTTYQSNKCIPVARLLSGRFRLGSLLRHFYPDRVSGICELCNLELEDTPHLIIPKCPKLADRAQLLMKYAQDLLSTCAVAASLFDTIIHGKDEDLKVQFLLDPSVIPQIISAAQNDKYLMERLFKVTTTWVYSLVRTRRKILNA